MSDRLFQLLEDVCDERTFLVFARALAADRRDAESREITADGFQGEWANQEISGFIESAVSWAEDSSFGVRPGPKPENSWTLFAKFLWAGRLYE